MPSYRYRCVQCRTTSRPVPTRYQATREGEHHRRQAHGGHHPDGEHILTPPRRGWREMSNRERLAAAVVVFSFIGIPLLYRLAHFLLV